MFIFDPSVGCLPRNRGPGGAGVAQGVPRLDSYNGVAVRILQSNNAGNIHHIIDPATNRVTGLIRGCPNAAQSDHSPGWPLLLLLERGGGYGRRVRHEDAAARDADPALRRPNKIVVNKKHGRSTRDLCRSSKCLDPGSADKRRRVVDVIDIATHKRGSQHRRPLTRCTTPT